ncbi:MAG: hypothetical protein AB9907_05205 [Flexilinea sp.]
METYAERYTGKKIALYLLIAFGIAWILQAVAITFYNDYLYLYTALLAISMLVPMLAALIVNSGLKTEKSGISWKIQLKKNEKESRCFS